MYVLLLFVVVPSPLSSARFFFTYRVYKNSCYQTDMFLFLRQNIYTAFLYKNRKVRQWELYRIRRLNLIPNLIKNNLLQGGLVIFYELLLFCWIINPDFTLKKNKHQLCVYFLCRLIWIVKEVLRRLGSSWKERSSNISNTKIFVWCYFQTLERELKVR